MIAFLYPAYVFYSRHDDQVRAERAAEEKQAERNAAEKRVIDGLGGSSLKINMFYANPRVAGKGQTVLLCYGVNQAKRVKIEPNVESIAPSLNRCVEARPSKTTEYVLTASDDKGNSATERVKVTVQ